MFWVFAILIFWVIRYVEPMTCEHKMSEAKDDGTHSYILPSHAVGCRLVKVPSIRKTKCNIYGKKMHSSKKKFKGAFLGQNVRYIPRFTKLVRKYV